jgi:hypothetical protein
MSNKSTAAVTTMGIDMGKNSFHVVGLDERGAIVLRQKRVRAQVGVRLANMPGCLIGMEACVGAHQLEPEAQGTWSRFPADAGEVCAPVFEGTEERLPRRGSDRRSGAAADDEVRRNQDG